jgi:hypothetical protein
MIGCSKITKRNFDALGGADNPDLYRTKYSDRWTYWRRDENPEDARADEYHREEVIQELGTAARDPDFDEFDDYDAGNITD